MKNSTETTKVAIAGAGTMGHGLALVMARAGCRVTLIDVDRKILEQALEQIRGHLEMLREEGLEKRPANEITDRIGTSVGKEALKDADFVIETVSEDRDIKRDFYREAESLCRPDTVVASNTSYLDIFELAPDGLQERLLVCHFFAPPYLIPLVEIVRGPQTRQDVVDRAKQLLSRAGQRPVVMEKFIPGFIVNRLQRAMGREILHLIDEGYARPEEIDKAVLSSLGIRLPVLGAVRRYDFGGLDLAQKVLSNPPIGLVNEEKESATVNDLVSRGHLGVKSGSGFYDYSGRDIREINRDRDRLLIKMRALMQEIEKTMWSEFSEEDQKD